MGVEGWSPLRMPNVVARAKGTRPRALLMASGCEEDGASSGLGLSVSSGLMGDVLTQQIWMIPLRSRHLKGRETLSGTTIHKW